MLAVPKCMLRTPANYMPAGYVMYQGHRYPAVWLNGTRRGMVPATAERYQPPIYDDQGNMIEPPRVIPRQEMRSGFFDTMLTGLTTAATGLAAYKAGEAGGFRRGAAAGAQFGYAAGRREVIDTVRPHIDDID